MREAERRARRRLRDDFPFYAERCLRIRPKAGGLAPFRLNAVQRHVHARLDDILARRGRVRALVLKARQPGVSTYVQARDPLRSQGGSRQVIPERGSVRARD